MLRSSLRGVGGETCGRKGLFPGTLTLIDTTPTFGFNVLNFKHEAWLILQRAQRLWGRWTPFSGSTNTRAGRGGVATRWEASVEAARWWLMEHP